MLFQIGADTFSAGQQLHQTEPPGGIIGNARHGRTPQVVIVPHVGIADELHPERGDPAGKEFFDLDLAFRQPGFAVLGGPDAVFRESAVTIRFARGGLLRDPDQFQIIDQQRTTVRLRAGTDQPVQGNDAIFEFRSPEKP